MLVRIKSGDTAITISFSSQGHFAIFYIVPKVLKSSVIFHLLLKMLLTLLPQNSVLSESLSRNKHAANKVCVMSEL